MEHPTRKGTIEAALFIANRPVMLEELARLAGCSEDDAEGLLAELREEYDERGAALRITVRENAEKLNLQEAVMEMRPEYASGVAPLSQNIELTRKAVKILALVAKKKKLLQSELKHYFRGDVYEYVDELERKGYLSSSKHKSTRELKPTKLFFERFKGVEQTAD